MPPTSSIPSPRTITQLLIKWNNGDRESLDQLMPLVYAELRSIADSYLRRERSDHTLQPTALVHEAYLRLVDQTNTTWENRAHFFGAAAQLMRQVLVDHARKHLAAKRGGLRHKVTLDKAINFSVNRSVDLVALDDALISLSNLDRDQSLIVELRFFGGLTVEETAKVMKRSPATIKREWRLAKAWLRREISQSDDHAD
ncbi:MAG: sigma-70 family RNA polymerase sigma factor [Acidobacteriota bacterium]|nr:sigma-70 family RNA polymerase sigma factor [Acidobacteriota bacterium]